MRNKFFIKLHIVLLIFVIAFSNVTAFAEANIIYAPTTMPTINNVEQSQEEVSPASTKIVASEAISVSSSYTQESIDYINVYDIVEKNNNYYCYENGDIVKNGWRKISRRSFAHISPVDDFNYEYIWAFFGSNGAAVRASNGSIRRVRIGNYTYSFNEFGQLLTGFFNESGEMWNPSHSEDPFDLLNDQGTLYHSSESNGAMTAGWYKLNFATSRYPDKDVIWLYFNPSSFKITRTTGNNYKSANIDGKTYAFDDNGVMLTGFEASKFNEEHGGSTKMVYFGEDGAEIKNGFYNLDMDNDINNEIFENFDEYDEDVTIFLTKNGLVYTNAIKKIYGSYYGFDKNGALVKGLSVWHNGEYVTTINTDDTNAKDFIISGSYIAKNGDREVLSDDYNLHYFDSRGRRVTTSAQIDFSDNTYTFAATNYGAMEGLHYGRYYKHGLLLKPESGIKFGVYIDSPTKDTYTMEELVETTNVVITSNGSVISSKTAQRDEDDNYWLILNKGLVNIYTVPIRVSGGTCYFKSTTSNGNENWIAFGEKDRNGRTCVTEVLPNGTRVEGGAISSFQTRLNSESAMNFKIR